MAFQEAVKMDLNLEEFESQFNRGIADVAELGVGDTREITRLEDEALEKAFLSLLNGTEDPLKLGILKAGRPEGQHFAEFLINLCHTMDAKIINEMMTPEQKERYEETGAMNITTEQGWQIPFVFARRFIDIILSSMSDNDVDLVAFWAFQVGRTIERSELRYQYEGEIKKRKNQKQALVKGNETIQAGSQKKRDKAVEELRHRIEANPRASKTSHIETMAKEKDGVHLRWGSRATLIKWCKHVKSPSRKNGK